MTNSSRARWKPILLRAVADFAAIHLSMLFALATVMAYYSTRGSDALSLTTELLKYYLHGFFPVSPIFSAVLFRNGVYDKARRYGLRQKLTLILHSSIWGGLALLSANYFFVRTNIVARSVTVVFMITVVVALSGSRALKWLLSRHYSVRPLDEPEEPTSPILIVGGAGYIGSILCDALIDAGERVRVLDSLVYGDFAIAHLKDHPDFELIVGDCRNIQNVVNAVKGAKAIVHLAAIVGDPACDQDRQSALEINFAATRMLVEIAKGHGVRRFLFASSCSVYGATDVTVGSSRVDLQACKLEYSIVSPK